MEYSRDSDAYLPTQTRAQRHALNRQTAPWQLRRRAPELGANAGPVRVLLLYRRLARPHHRLRRHLEGERKFPGGAAGLVGCGARSGSFHAVHPVAHSAARRTSPAVLDDYAAGLAGARANL